LGHIASRVYIFLQATDFIDLYEVFGKKSLAEAYTNKLNYT